MYLEISSSARTQEGISYYSGPFSVISAPPIQNSGNRTLNAGGRQVLSLLALLVQKYKY